MPNETLPEPRRSARPSRWGVGALAVAALAGLLLGVRAFGGADAQPSPPLQDLPPSCSGPNPFLATTCFVRGETFDEDPAVVAFHDDPNDLNHFKLATIGEVGSVWGMAYDPYRDKLYASSFHRRNSKIGPMGPGGIYEIDVAGGGATPFLTVPNAGTIRHDPTNDYQPDDRARRYVGETDLGDIDLSDDGSELFAMNLRDKRIYRFAMPDGTPKGSFASGGLSENWQQDSRPFGLKVKDGWVYHGVVNSARKRQSLTNLWAYVYASRPDGSGMRRVAEVWLGHDRGANHLDWRPWPEDDDLGWRRSQFPHPMLTDIEFTASGDMILGLRDRYIDTGPSLTEVYRRAPGDTLLARKTGDWTYEVEDLSDNDEYYDEGRLDVPGGNNDWLERAVGGLTVIPGLDVLVTTAANPRRTFSDGALWFRNDDGSLFAEEELLYNRGRHEGPQGKAQGLGDVEWVCYEPPTPTPTNTGQPTPTATQTPSPSVTPESTPTASSTPTAPTWTIYLPYGEHEEFCIDKKRYIDVVLVLDRSTSMLRSVEEGGMQKNEAAIQAAMTFVDMLSLEPDADGRHDQVAVVGFNDTAWREQDLTNDRKAALEALKRLRTQTAEGTRLDLAFQEGQAPLSGPAHIPENLPVLVVLTDGLPNRVPFGPGERQEDTVLRMAEEAKQAGSRVYTIGLGGPRDINGRMMLEAASEPWTYYYAPRPEDLAGIYRQIAEDFIKCDPDAPPKATPCIPEFVHTDVVLVLDMSTSMYRETRSGRTKHEAAIAAARSFVSMLDFEPDGWGRRDQVGIVGFNDEAWTETRLTGDPLKADAALATILERIAEGTRLDLALEEGQSVYLQGGRDTVNRAVLVLLTDGLPNRVPTPVGGGSQEDTVLAAAAAAKARGTRVFTVGLGMPDEVLQQLLEEAASSPRDYYFAPDGEDLEGIYRQIAGRINECAPAGGTP